MCRFIRKIAAVIYRLNDFKPETSFCFVAINYLSDKATHFLFFQQPCNETDHDRIWAGASLVGLCPSWSPSSLPSHPFRPVITTAAPMLWRSPVSPKLVWAELIKAALLLIKLFVFAKRSPPAHCCSLMSGCVTASRSLAKKGDESWEREKHWPSMARFLTSRADTVFACRWILSVWDC